MIFVKTHKTEEREITAMCDEELLGKFFEDRSLCLEVKESFYKGRLVDEDEAVNIIKNADILNLVGERAVGLAVRSGVVSKIHIIKIKGIPHAQVI